MPTPPNPGTPPNFNVRGISGNGGLMSGIGFGTGGLYQYRPPDEHLVAGQLRKNINTRSPLMLQAAGNAQELANARGMGTGAYAIGEAQRATIDSMLPVAQQDSETLTKVGMMNANAAQEKANLEASLNARSASEGGQTVLDMTGEEEANRQHQLQLQRERLAFEGEQSAYGRDQQSSMGLMDIYGNMYQGQQNFANQRQLGFDEFGFGRTMANDQFGYGRMLANDQFGYNSQLANQNADLDIRQSYFNYRQGQARDLQSFYQNIILGGMGNPEFMADPQAFFGFAQFATGMVEGPGSSFFRNLFGRGG